MLKKKIYIKMSLNINFLWNFGSLISLFMMIQFFIGFFLSMNYLIFLNKFNNSIFINLNLNFGWLIRLIHSNLTSMIYIFFLIHLYRNLMFYSFFLKFIWLTGMLMFLTYMMISFIGYTLTWTQMSYWGMMVITNFISIIPIYGKMLMLWMWGNFNINMILINRFFSIHFIFPMIIFLFIFIHLNLIHLSKSNNPFGINKIIDQMNLFPNFIIKDLMMMLIFFFIIMNIIFFFPSFFYEFDNFNKMNYFKTPNHIKPEWYFLFFYSILRSIENKLNGLILLIIFILLMIFLPLYFKNKFQSLKFKKTKKMNFFIYLFMLIFISFMGSKNIEFPFLILNKILINLIFLNYIFLL